MTLRKQKRIVFLIRAFNDIDHFTPLIDRVASDREFEVSVYSVNWKYDLNANPNVAYLFKRRGVSVSYLWGGPDSSLIEKITLRSIEKVSRSVTFFRKRLSRFNRYRKKCEYWLYAQLPTTKIFRPQKPEVVIFDWMNAEHPRNRSIVMQCNHENIPTVCLPHGVWVYSNEFATQKRALADPEKNLYFDLYPCPGKHTDYLVERGVPVARVVELGSMRYCQKWLEIYLKEIANSSYVGRSGSALKLVIFLSQSFYNVDDDALCRLISEVSLIPGLDIAIKPHTRGISIEYIQEIMGDNEIEICGDVSSVELIAWADAAIVYGSSIAIQVLSQNKVLLYPDFIDTNTVHFADMKACWIVRSASEMADALRALSNETAQVPYKRESVDKFLSQVVYAGKEPGDVIQDHLDEIMSLVEKHPRLGHGGINRGSSEN